MRSSESIIDENRQLRRTMRDLVALSTLPAIWVGLDLRGIARSLSDVLLNTLSLDLIYVRLSSMSNDDVIELVRSRHQRNVLLEPIRTALTPFLVDTRGDHSSTTIPDPTGTGILHVAVTRFGVADDHGVLISASRNSEFPTEQDRLLLGVVANQTAILLQRQRTEAQVRQQSEQLRTTLASIGDAVITTDLSGRVTNI
ncbi:MAG: chemotaxis protein methyltransferase CheR, partial [Planctomycetaceae bacterium]|nr:chemotaxis protein methyltransferase CheR [Planctomycetaceae bacterium]